VCEVFEAMSAALCHTLQSWPITRAMFQGVSLYNHLREEEALLFEKATRLGDRRGYRKYQSTLHIPRHVGVKKRKDRLIEVYSINDTVNSGCCKHHCINYFDAPLIHTLRHEMHHSDSKFKDGLRLGVHRQSQCVPGQSKKMCSLEGRLVCLEAWQKISGVSKTDFYRYKQYATTGRRAQDHGGKGRRKISDSKLQAIQTMKMLLESKADPMPHKTRNLKTGEKVVQKILPSGTKWKGLLEVVNTVIFFTDMILSHAIFANDIFYFLLVIILMLMYHMYSYTDSRQM
jgi:hypothetical protein